VYFDDLKISYQKSQVVQHNSYYAFGMTAESWTRFDTKPNQYLYNAGSELNAKTGSYEMYFRNYDPAIARMSGVDVMAESYASLTPYQYANNDPVYWNDPTGAYAGGDEWWNAPREMWRGGMDPQQRREQERFYANESTGTSVDPFAWTGIKTSDIYGRGANTFGSGYLPGDYYGTARLGMEYDVYEVWMDYYTNGRYDESVFKGYRYEEKNRAFYPTGNKIVGNYDFAKTGNGWTAEITGLGVGAVNTKPKQIVLVELGSLCITIKPVGPNTKQAASDAFVKSWNTMTDRLDSWLNAQGDRLITTPELQRQIMLIFNTQLNMNTLYSSTSLGPCSGSIPVTPAQYSSWWDDIFK